LNLTAQITPEDKNSAPIGANGKLMVWIPRQIGSNLAAHWAESDSAEAKLVEHSSSYGLKNMTNKQNQGASPLNSGIKMTTSSNPGGF
jgi:hypothetical protein